jgi:hypothetical protein
MLCSDDTSNENFIKSYLNRLDCKPIDLSCLKGSNLPCKESTTITACNLTVDVNVTINEDGNYVFTPTILNGVTPFVYNWIYQNGLNNDFWQLISSTNSAVLILKPLLLFSGTITSGITLRVLDSVGCFDVWTDEVTYRGGCTNPEAVNYDPLATIDNGTCYYDPLLISSAYECQEDDTGTLCIQASGGTPPYTVVGVPNGTILLDGGTLCTNLPNGATFSFYVIDSLGAVSLIQRGTIDCPFDCMFADIKDNYVVTCLTDEFGFNTGEATLTLTPSGGNAPYTVVGTINGGIIGPFINLGGGVWSPDQEVMNGDKVTGTITDANGCFYNFDIDIDCPLPEPGGGGGFDCIDFGEINISATLYVSSLLPAIVPLSASKANYSVSFQLTNLGSLGLNYSNIATFEYKLENTSPGLINHYPFGISGSPCNPCIGTLTHLTTTSPVVYATNNSVGLSPSHSAVIPICTSGAFKNIDAIIKVRLTVVTEDVVCTLCFSGELNAVASCASGVGSDSTGLTLIDCNEY